MLTIFSTGKWKSTERRKEHYSTQFSLSRDKKSHKRVIPNLTAMAKDHWHHRHKSKSLGMEDMIFMDDNYI